MTGPFFFFFFFLLIGDRDVAFSDMWQTLVAGVVLCGVLCPIDYELVVLRCHSRSARHVLLA